MHCIESWKNSLFRPNSYLFIYLFICCLLKDPNIFLASIKLKALFCSWNTQIAFNGVMVIMFWRFPKLDEWVNQKDMNSLLGGAVEDHMQQSALH